MSSPPSLAGRVVLVTGGGVNLGRAIAIAAAAAGAAVVVFSRRRALLAETVATIAAHGGRALAVAGDVTQLADLEAAVAAGERAFGSIDGLAAIAGGGGAEQAVDRVDPAAWANVITTNLVGTFHSVRAVLPRMRARGVGTIVTCVGGGAFFPALGATISAYASAKAGLCRLTDQLAVELLATGIRVNAVEPGQVVPTAMWLATPPAARAGCHPPEHAAELATFLLAEASAPLTGRTVTVDEDWWRDRTRLLAVAQDQHAACLRRIVP
ncbi:MAG: SDR family NAD(P)-dependent oxidoreductase [Planctomycetes bacterium]|nr:SDR family NAD(P)-dependent oxidoreductase [Planctomycetota bacterium]